MPASAFACTPTSSSIPPPFDLPQKKTGRSSSFFPSPNPGCPVDWPAPVRWLAARWQTTSGPSHGCVLCSLWNMFWFSIVTGSLGPWRRPRQHHHPSGIQKRQHLPAIIFGCKLRQDKRDLYPGRAFRFQAFHHWASRVAVGSTKCWNQKAAQLWQQQADPICQMPSEADSSLHVTRWIVKEVENMFDHAFSCSIFLQSSCTSMPIDVWFIYFKTCVWGRQCVQKNFWQDFKCWGGADAWENNFASRKFYMAARIRSCFDSFGFSGPWRRDSKTFLLGPQSCSIEFVVASCSPYKPRLEDRRHQTYS